MCAPVDPDYRLPVRISVVALKPVVETMVIVMKPGFKITVEVPFDVPTGTLPAAIELHDSVFTGGARVQLN